MNTNIPRNHRGKDGMVLFVVLAILSGLALVSGTMFTLTSTDIKISGNYRESVQAFYQADAGINYVKAQIEDALGSGDLSLDAAVESVNFQAPSGFSFDSVTAISRQVDLSTNDIYGFSATGRSGNSNSRIEVTFRRRPAFPMGVFGDDFVDMKNSGSFFSYDSTIDPNPVAADSTGEASAGANGTYTTHNNSVIDGDLLLGADEFGTTATWADPGSGGIVNGDAGVEIGRVEPDPLGAIGGSLADQFTYVSTHNNNATAGIGADNEIGGGTTLTAGDYYISDITLGNGDALTIDSSGGRGRIFLYGGIEAKNGSEINTGNNPDDFHIFSNSSDAITIKHGAEIRCLLYSPFADVELKNSGDFLGLVWAAGVDVKNSGEFFIDTSLQNNFLSNKIRLLTWKEER